MKSIVDELTDLNNFYTRNSKIIGEKSVQIVMERTDFEKYFDSLKNVMSEVMSQVYGCYASGNHFDFERAASCMIRDIGKNILAISKIHQEDYDKNRINEKLM